MRIRLIGEQKIVMSAPECDHPYFAWPTAVRLQNGRIAVGASGFRVEHICPFGKAVICFSDDEGETFSVPVPVIDTVLDDRDAGLATYGESGLILTSFNNTLEFQRENMPQTQECFDYINSVPSEEEAKVLGCTFKLSDDCGKSFSELHLSPVTSPHGPIELRDGTLLWVGKVFDKQIMQAYTVDTQSGKTEFVGEIDISGFDGLFFYEPHAIELPDGRILCQMRVQNHDESIFTLYQTVSSDKGKTWSRPAPIINYNSGAPAHLFMHSSGVLISAFSHRAMPCGIHLIFSTDCGETWSEEHKIYKNTETDDLGYPSTVELNDGSLLTVFYARDDEEHPAVIRAQRWAFEE